MYKSSIDDPRQKMYTPNGQEVQGYTVKELTEMKIALNRKLGPEFISKRQGPGCNVQYLEGWKAINLANEIFGPNGWSTELKEFKVDYIEERSGTINLGLSCIVRVILKDGTFHEDVGYGSIERCRSKAMAFDKCKKEAVTDGMKRALRQFGNALGNCLYDKDFLKKITNVASEPSDFDENKLMRRSNTNQNTIVKQESNDSTYKKNNVQNENRNRSLEKVSNIPNSILPGLRNNSESPIPINKQINILKTDNNDLHVVDKNKGSKGLVPKNDKAQSEETNDDQRKDVDIDDFGDSFLAADWSDEEENGERILLSNNFMKGGALPDSDFELAEDTDIQEQSTTINNNTNNNSTENNFTLTTNNENENENIPTNVTFVSAKSANKIQENPALQKDLKYDISSISSQQNKSSFINHSKSLPVKKTQIKATVAQDMNKENSNKEAPITATNKSKFTLGSNKGPLNNNLGIGSGNPMIKRSFGLPPNKLSNKRLKKNE